MARKRQSEEDVDRPEDVEAAADTDVEGDADDVADEVGDEVGDEVDDVIGDDIGDEDVAIDEDDVAVEAEAEAETETDEEDEEVAAAPRGRTVAARGRTKRADSDALHTVAAREDLRRKLAADVEAFLERGGAIQDVPQDTRAEPQKKPDSSYGRGSA
jgi:hypothetical protein